MADRPLLDLNGFSATMASNINDLPITSPHGGDFGLHSRILGLASYPNTIRGTPTAHCTCVATFHPTLEFRGRAALQRCEMFIRKENTGQTSSSAVTFPRSQHPS